MLHTYMHIVFHVILLSVYAVCNTALSLSYDFASSHVGNCFIGMLYLFMYIIYVIALTDRSHDTGFQRSFAISVHPSIMGERFVTAVIVKAARWRVCIQLKETSITFSVHLLWEGWS